ncbi:MAG: hypothetical protein HKN23_16585, partial [Verrucomicrobiales bacterium]|nr:hypothetical protein [Verrucomicrobiales bacterium]
MIPSNLPGEDWPNYRGPDRNGQLNVAFDPILDADFDVLWKVELGDTARHSCPVISDGK